MPPASHNGSSNPLVRWSTIIQITNSKFVSLAWPAFSIIPLLAVVLSLLREADQQGHSLALVLFGERIAATLKAIHYPSLLFFWYFAYLFFWIGAIIARSACPPRIYRHKNFETYIRFIASAHAAAQQRTETREVGAEDDDAVGDDFVRALQDLVTDEERNEAGVEWGKDEIEKRLGKIFSLLFLIPSFLVIGWGVFVFVPVQVLGGDDLTHLVRNYFLLNSVLP